MAAPLLQTDEFKLFMHKYMGLIGAGSISQTAILFGVSRQHFYKWLGGGVPSWIQQGKICRTIADNTDVHLEVIIDELLAIIKNALLCLDSRA